MMHEAIMLLKEQLDNVLQHNKCFSLLPDVLNSAKTANEKTNTIIQSWTNERIFNYRSNIISIYGSFEQFIESSIKEYVKELLKVCSSFSELDDAIQNKYIEKWKALHGKLHYSKFNAITSNYMVESLYKSQIENKNEVIAECFLLNGGNYKHKEIMESFSNLGVSDIRMSLEHYEPLASHFLKNGFDNYAKIDELVERRNEIAHGANSGELLSEDIVLDYVDYVAKYACSMTAYLNDQILSHMWLLRKALGIYKPTNIYSRKSIVEFSVKDLLLKTGMDFLIKRSKDFYPRYIFGTLPKFRVKNMSIPDSQIEEKQELFGDGDWKFSFHIKDKITINSRFAFYL